MKGNLLRTETIRSSGIPPALGRGMRGIVSILAGLGALLAPARAAQEYRYIEAEAYAVTEGSGVRLEGFTNWMRHPSHGRVMVLDGKGFLEYQVRGLGPGPYHVFVRGLAFASGADVDLLWDGEKIGRASYAQPATALKWSRTVGVVHGPGDHVLRVANDPANTQAPYVDVILLTTQPGYRPSDEDQDFASFTTPLPLLALKVGDQEEGVPPLPGSESAADAPVDVAAARAGPLGIGPNEVHLELRNPGERERRLEVTARLGEGDARTAQVRLAPGATTSVSVSCDASSAGQALLAVGMRENGRGILSGAYRVRVPDPVKVSLDTYACPVGTERVAWRAAFTAAPEIVREVEVDLALLDARGERVIDRRRLPCTEPALEAPLATRDLPVGRYLVRAEFRRRGGAMAREERELFVFRPEPNEAWEPVKRTEARGDTILMNGKPFLPRLLYHATAEARLREQGFNLVQCWGSDPDPRAGIQDHLDRCAKAGIWGTVALFNNRYFCPGSRFDLDHLRDAVLRFKDHPALWCWDLVDEPEGPGMTPETVAEAARLVRELDPNHLVWVNLCRLDRATDFLASQDVWSFDHYPIPGQGVFGYLPWLKASDEKLRGKLPLGTCLQTYAYAGSRMPRPDELKASAYLHLIHGYKWLGYYSYFDPEPSGCLARDPVLWSYTRALNSELRALAPAILDAAPMESVRADVDPGRFRAGAKRVGDSLTLLAVNGTEEPLRVHMEVAGTSAKVLFEEERAIPIRDGILEDTLPPSAGRAYVVR